MSEQKYYKFLAGNLASGQDPAFYYPAPTYDAKGDHWEPGAWVKALDVTEETEAAESGQACGHGLHLMKIPKPLYIRWTGNAYLAEGEGLLGEDFEKARFRRVRLIRPLTFWEIFHAEVDLSGANLYGANMSGADLYGADLSVANLSVANLSRANLSRANMSRANLSVANLSGADLYGADLSVANLYGANLSGANLSGANLYGANLSRANMSRAIVGEEQLRDAASTEGIIGWAPMKKF